MSRRLTKHELKEDKFVTTIYRWSDRLREHRAAVIGAAVAIVAIIVMVGVYQRNTRSTAAASEQLLFTGLQAYDSGRYQEARTTLTEFLDQNPRHHRRAVASVALGNTHLALDEYSQARPRFELALKSSEVGSGPWVAAKEGLGSAAAEQGLIDEALRHYNEAADAALSDEAAAEALVDAIHVLFMTDQGEPARQLIARVRADYPRTRAAQRLDVYEGLFAAAASPTPLPDPVPSDSEPADPATVPAATEDPTP